MDEGFEYTFLQKRYTKGQYEKMPNHNEIPFHTHYDGDNQKDRHQKKKKEAITSVGEDTEKLGGLVLARKQSSNPSKG